MLAALEIASRPTSEFMAEFLGIAVLGCVPPRTAEDQSSDNDWQAGKRQDSLKGTKQLAG
jgi:hypothetical protein